jgi:hypothetical protein
MYDKLQALSDPTTQIAPAKALDILDRLYGALGALDQTSAAILTFDAILITAAVFSAQRAPTNPGSPAPPAPPASQDLERRLAQLVILVALVSAGLALWVDRVSYPFLDNVVKTPGNLDFKPELLALDGEIALRTQLYRAAWYLSVTAVGVFLLRILWILRTLPQEICEWAKSKIEKFVSG